MLGSHEETEIGRNGAVPMFDEDDELEARQLRETTHKRQKRRKRLLTLICILIVLGVILAIIGPTALNKLIPHTTSYQFKPVTQGTLTVSASATGPVQSNVYNATFGTTGKVAEIDVTVGQTVKVGQKLAKLDTKLLQDAVDQANANSASDQVATAKDTLAAATLYAPHAGVITAINGTIGGPSSVGSGTAGGFIQIVDNSTLSIQANVSESDIASVQTGNSVQFTVSAYNDRTFKGTVTTVVQQGTNTANVVTFPVLITIDMSSLQKAIILPGMTASVTINEAVRQNVLLISTDAINFAKSYSLVTATQRTDALNGANSMLSSLLASNPTSAQDNPTAAYVLEKDGGHWSVLPVVLGLTDGNVYEVLSGLSLGGNIAVSSGNTTPTQSTNSSTSGSGGGGD